MAFVVEDGSIVAGANSYLSVAAYKAYWLDRGVTVSDTDAEIEAALVKSTDYVDNNNSWKGEIVSASQALDWPRSGVYDSEGRLIGDDTIPTGLKNAVAEYGSRALTASLQPDPDGKGQVTKEKVDVIEVEYAEGSGGYYGNKSYPAADNWLKGLTLSSGAIGGLYRGA